MKTGFFAYSSKLASCGQSIEPAIQEINDGGVTKLQSWKEFDINGIFIIDPILYAIDQADYFCADLTGLNDNVLFELGYAIAKRKPLWLLLDSSITKAQTRYKQFGLLTNVGYRAYTNSNAIVKSFYEDQPYEKTHDVLTDYIKNTTSKSEGTPILFLKGQIDTNYSRTLIDSTREFRIPFVLDDPVENKSQTFAWYFQKSINAAALITEFSSNERSGHEFHNSKCSLISGLGLGLGLKLLMVSEEPYEVPIDYGELLKKYDTQVQCQKVVSIFLGELRKEVFDLYSKKERYIEKQKKRSRLQKIAFGEFLAEHESEELYDYYVETSTSESLVKNEYNIVVGRKGTGKTATLYFLQHTLSADIRNHVILIKPVSFELEALLSLLRKIPPGFERSYLIESTWKFLIYTEIAKAFYFKIENKSEFALDDHERAFMDFCKNKKDLIMTDLTVRLEEQILRINPDDLPKSSQDYRLRISEILHGGILKEIRTHLGKVVDSGHRIVVLIDNLDKSWKKNSELELQSKWILGLLGITGRIVRDFSNIKNRLEGINFHLTLFLRSDIFRFMLDYAREPDKIEYIRLKMDDPQVLFRIIEERFVELSEDEVTAEHLWKEYVVSDVGGVGIKTYVYDHIIPRPRDIIYFFNKAKENAVFRGHTRIEQDDITDAVKEYSSWLFKSLLVENGITVDQFEEFLFEFLGEPQIVNYDKILAAMKSTGIDTSESIMVEYFIDHLVSLSIFGRETKSNIFEFETVLESSKKLKKLAEKLGSKRYKVHSALVDYLECPDDSQVS